MKKGQRSQQERRCVFILQTTKKTFGESSLLRSIKGLYYIKRTTYVYIWIKGSLPDSLVRSTAAGLGIENPTSLNAIITISYCAYSSKLSSMYELLVGSSMVIVRGNVSLVTFGLSAISLNVML